MRANALARSGDWSAAARLLTALLRRHPTNHFLLIKRGLCDHNRYRYAAALIWFRRSVEAAPTCPCAKYNLANTMFQLDRLKEAHAILSDLALKTPRQIEAACEDAVEDGAAFLADVEYLLFHVVIERDKDFAAAEPHLHRYLAQRNSRRSLWTLKTVRREVNEYRKAYGGWPPAARR